MSSTRDEINRIKSVLLVGDPSGLNCCDVVVSAVLCTIEEGAAAGGGVLDL